MTLTALNIFVKINIMKKAIILFISFLTLGFTTVEDTSTIYSFLGKWKSFEGEIINVKFNENNEVYFNRSYDGDIISEGIIAVENAYLVVSRIDSVLDYKLKYAFSKDAQTLVVMKPNSNQAWLLNRISW